MKHEMRLHPLPFKQIIDGSKTIEIRLFDEKRQQFNVGDVIRFTNRDTKEVLNVKIVELLKYQSFTELFDSNTPESFGATTRSELDSIYTYYSKEDESKYGALGIVIELTD